MMVPVRNINLKNKEFLEIVDEYKDALMNIEDNGKPMVANNAPLSHKKDKPEDYLSDEYMNKIMNEGRMHSGFPVVLKGYGGLKWQDFEERTNPAKAPVMEATTILNSKLIQFLSCRNNALNACYPPGGFISWHNNANAPGYNLIASWSETGEGWFDYYDLDKKERVRVPDEKGWNCKMTYFGPYHEEDKLCYHAAYTDCYRITIAYVFAEANDFWEEVIEDLETEF